MCFACILSVSAILCYTYLPQSINFSTSQNILSNAKQGENYGATKSD
jgi:hypothetical protein